MVKRSALSVIGTSQTVKSNNNTCQRRVSCLWWCSRWQSRNRLNAFLCIIFETMNCIQLVTGADIHESQMKDIRISCHTIHIKPPQCLFCDNLPSIVLSYTDQQWILDLIFIWPKTSGKKQNKTKKTHLIPPRERQCTYFCITWADSH